MKRATRSTVNRSRSNDDAGRYARGIDHRSKGDCSMRKLISVLGVAVLLSLVAISTKAQDEAPGQIVTVSVSAPVGGVLCGSSPLYCYTVPFTTNGGDFIQGTFWSDIFPNAYPSSYGFIAGRGTAGWDLGTIALSQINVTHDQQGFITGVDFNLSGTTDDGDNESYHGTGHFTFTHTNVRCLRGTCHNYYMQAGSGFSVAYN